MSMPLLDKLETELDALSAKSLRRRRRVAESGCAPRVQVDGKPMLAFCSNDYLGLASHPAVAEALREGASLYGTGSGASHLISGHSIAHAQLEEKTGRLHVAASGVGTRAVFLHRLHGQPGRHYRAGCR